MECILALLKVHKLVKIVINVDLCRMKYSGPYSPTFFKEINCLHFDAMANLQLECQS